MKNQNKLKVVITGSEGRMGTILKEGLSNDFNLYLVDKKKSKLKNSYKLDIAKDFIRLKSILRLKDVVIHLAWDNREDFPNNKVVFENKIMAENIYRSAVKVGIKRVIIASSVHADDYSSKRKNEISPLSNPWPDTPYGASKVYIENLGKYYSMAYGLEVICIRFGGVNPQNKILYSEDQNYDKVLLYKEDLLDLIRKCLECRKVPSNYSLFYAVSNNLRRVHSFNNFLGWKPKFPKV